MTKSLVNRLYLKQKWYTFKMQSGKSMEDHMNEFNKIIDLEFCEHCVYGKMQRVKFTTKKHCSKGIQEHVIYGGLLE